VPLVFLVQPVAALALDAVPTVSAAIAAADSAAAASFFFIPDLLGVTQ
jgi:hypothetical protein